MRRAVFCGAALLAAGGLLAAAGPAAAGPAAAGPALAHQPAPARGSAATASADPRSRVWAWGAGTSGQVGIGKDRAIRVEPVPVHLGVPLQIVGGGGVVLGLYQGAVWAWGSGPLGNGSSYSPSPVQITTLPAIRELAATHPNASGEGQAFYALADDGRVWAWGSGINGELGDGSFASSLTPVPVKGLTGIGAIYAGADTAYALRSPGDNRLFAWGMGTAGQLGNGQLASNDTPVPVQLPDGVHQVASACGSTYALSSRRPGRIFAWGGNFTGQLGDGTRSNAAAPVLVRRVTAATAVAAACGAAYAITGPARTVMAWGSGAQGQMGDGHKATRVYPVPVTGLSGVTSLTAGVATAYAVVLDGSVWAWGQGSDGNLGDGQLSNDPVPAKLTTITSQVKAVVTVNTGSPGYNASVALGTDGSLWSWGAYYAGWTGATGLGPEGGTATASRVPRVPPACRVATLGGDVWFASLC